MKRNLTITILALIAAAIGLAVLAWRITGPSKLTLHGYIALAIALVLGGGLGAGLMALAFYSQRKGWDDQQER
jgi:hypothetical protein